MSLKDKAVFGVKSLGLLQVARIGISLISLGIFARLLNPEDFGLVAMATVVTAFIMQFGDLGFASAVIRRKDCNQEFLSSVFWLTLALGLVLTVFVWSLAPIVGRAYLQPGVSPIVQGLSIGLLVQAALTVPKSLLERDLAFVKLAILEFTALVLGTSVGILCAVLGAGVWSLVINAVAIPSILCLLIWSQLSWRPNRIFHWTEVTSNLGYSLYQTGAMITNFFARNADNALIGRFIGATDLAYYNMAYRLLLFPLQNISAVLIRVLFPVMSKNQDDNAAIRKIHLKYVSYVSLCTFPMMILLGLLAEPIVRVLFGPGWGPVADILVVFSGVGAIQSIAHTGIIYRAKGRTDLMFVWSIVTTLVYVSAFVIGLGWGIFGVAVGYGIAALILILPGLWLAFRLIDLSLILFLKTLVPSIIAASLMGIVIYMFHVGLAQSWRPIVQVISLSLIGMFSYVAILSLARVRVFFELIELMLGTSVRNPVLASWLRIS